MISRNLMAITLAVTLVLLGQNAAQLVSASLQLARQNERWAASRAEQALSRELFRIQTEINAGVAGELYEHYGPYRIQNFNDPPKKPKNNEAFARLERLRFLSPRYPEAASSQGIGGSCTIWFTVDTAGAVSEAEVEGCHEAFHPELIETALTWRFEPVLEDGVAVEHRASTTVTFKHRTGAPEGADASERVTRTLYDALVEKRYQARMRAVAKRWEPTESTAQLVVEDETPFVLVYSADSDEVWVFFWDRIEETVEQRSGVQITLDPEHGRRKLAMGRVLVDSEIWLGREVWTTQVRGRTRPGAWRASAEQWTIPPSLSGVFLLLFGALSLLATGLLVGLRSLRRAQQQARAEAREALLQRISHELRTPAASALSMVGVLQDVDTLSADERAQFATLLRDEVERLARGLDRMLRTARGELHPAFSPVPIDLTEWTTETARRWRARIPGLILHAPDAPLRVLADPERLDEAVDALLDNAAKHGRPPVTLRLEASAGAGAARLSIEDGGPGVPASERARVFERQARATTEASGFGVGLWAAREVARAHGGTLMLEDGSRFVLTLPGVL